MVKPASQARRTGSVMVDALWEAGVPRDVLRLVQLTEHDLGRRLVSDPRVDRLILTGAYETAELFRSFRDDLPLLAETSGKNSIIVAPSADIDLAVKDVVYSAFGHAGQKCSAASLVILVGSVATSKRFRNQLVDAVTSLKVGLPADATTQMGPMIEPPKGKLLKALTTLDPGESWVVEPKQLDDGKLWSPGVKEGVARGSEYHLVEYFGPVLGIMTADSLEQAVEIQNEVAYGLTAGLHSLDPDDLKLWLDRVQAGNLYVNRGTTGAIVRRQPFGGWKKSAVGAGTKAGGPNYLVGLSDWEPAQATATAEIPAGPATLLAVAPPERRESLERALRSDAAAWASEFGTAKDVSQLGVERNVFRYDPHPVTIRYAAGSTITDLLRVAAGRRTQRRAGDHFVVRRGAVRRPERDRRAGDRGPGRGRRDLARPGGVAGRWPDPAAWRVRRRAVRRGRRPPGYRGLRPAGHRGGPGRAAAVPARAGRQHHRAPLRHAEPPVRRPHLTVPATSRRRARAWAIVSRSAGFLASSPPVPDAACRPARTARAAPEPPRPAC